MRNAIIALAPLIVGVIFFCTPTHAAVFCGVNSYYGTPEDGGWSNLSCIIPDSGGLHGIWHSTTPFELCPKFQFIEAGEEPGCTISKGGFAAGAYSVQSVYKDGMPWRGFTWVSQVPPHNTCWYDGWAAYTGGIASTAVPSGCTQCPEGTSLTDVGCTEEPECDEGWIFDEEISECRLQCNEADEYYSYSNHYCQKQCPASGSPPYMYRSNQKLDVPATTSAINGCKMTTHSFCHYDSAHTYENSQMCMTWFTYGESIPISVISQAEYEEQVGAADGYLQDDHGPVVNGAAESEVDPANWLALGDSEPVSLTEVKYWCYGGVARLSFLKDGVLDEAVFLGACPDGENADIPAEGVGGGDVATQIADIHEATSDDGPLGDIKRAVEEMKTAMLGEEGSDPPTFSDPIDTPSGPSNAYPAGLSDAVGSGDLGSTSLKTWLDSFELSLGPSAAECPSFTFPAVRPFFGEFTFTPYCAIWDVLAALVMATAAFIAWTIVWRV